MDDIRQELEGFAGQGSNFGAMVDRIRGEIPSEHVNLPVATAKKRGPYPYYRLSNYVNMKEEGYRTVADMYWKYYHGKRPCAIAKSGRVGKQYDVSGDYVALWLMGSEAVDQDTKEIGNNEPMGEIIASWDWCPDLEKKVNNG